MRKKKTQPSLNREDLLKYIGFQLDSFFDGYKLYGNDVVSALNLGIDQLENCFKYITFPAYVIRRDRLFLSFTFRSIFSVFVLFFK